MNPRISSTLFSYAVLLLLAGLFSVLYNHNHVFGWNEAGKSGLIACGSGAVLAAVFGGFAKKGAGWALWAGLVLAFLFICQCGFSSFKLARSLDENHNDWFKLTINLIALVASLRAFIVLGLIARHRTEP